MTRYQIRIDGELYESSAKEEEAIRLYRTVDRTCMRQYNGRTKTLVKMEDDKEEVLKSEIIKSVTLDMRM